MSNLNPVALRTSDPKFTPRWVDVPAPTVAPTFENRTHGYSAGARKPGTFDIAYCLVDEEYKVGAVSAYVTIATTTTEWDVVGRLPALPLWTRSVGVLWVWREAGTEAWYPFAVDENHAHNWQALKPFKTVAGWHHSVGGVKLFPVGAGFGTLADYQQSVTTSETLPAPYIRLLECPNVAYEMAFSWACNQGETALCPAITAQPIAGVAATMHAPFRVVRQFPGGKLSPPQGALGLYVYVRATGGAWHRQPTPDGMNGYLWNLGCQTITIARFVESGIAPQAGGGHSYLSSLHLAMRDWRRDVIIDSDFDICCPIISEYNGGTWDYQPKNHWVASYGTTSGAGTWTLTIDGVTSPPMPRVADYGVNWQQWRVALDACFGVGNVIISDYWVNFAPKIEFSGKYAGQNMTGRFAVTVRDSADAVVDSHIVASQIGQDWIYLPDAGWLKFKRKISTSNAGNWVVRDAIATPDGITGYPMGWCPWLECSQRTKLVGCDFLMMQAACGIDTVDTSGGGCFHFNVVECTAAVQVGNTQPVTYGFRCLDNSSYGWNGHLCSELIIEKCHFQAKFPIVCEGVQAANWQIRDCTCFADGSIDSAIITAANAGTLYLGGRFTCDNARTLVASLACKKVTVENLWIDGGMPALMTCNANGFTMLDIKGGKINQWANWLHAIEMPAGPAEPYQSILKTDSLDSQQNAAVDVRMCSPKAEQCVYQPKVVAEVPALLEPLV